MIKVYGYSKCTTVKKSLAFLKNNNIEFIHIDNVDNKFSVEEIKFIHQTSGVDIKKMFNTSGIKYRELNIKDKLPIMSIEEKYELLASDGMLVKRPIIITDKGICFGFKENEWVEII